MRKYKEQVPLHTIKTKEMRPMGFDIIDLPGKNGKEYDSTVPHRHTFFELFFFNEGTGRHEIDFRNFEVEANNVHFVSPGQIHHLSLRNCKGFVVCFTEDFVSLADKGNFTEHFPFYEDPRVPYLNLDKATGAELNMLIRCASQELKLKRDTEILRSYLNIVLLKIKSVFVEKEGISTPAHDQKKNKVTTFKKLINSEYLNHMPVSAYADRLFVSPNHLNALCKKHDGRTATQLIQERLLLESKRLLFATDLQIKEISHYLRFEDVPYFNRFFKRQTKLTPVQYRLNILKNH